MEYILGPTNQCFFLVQHRAKIFRGQTAALNNQIWLNTYKGILSHFINIWKEIMCNIWCLLLFLNECFFLKFNVSSYQVILLKKLKMNTKQWAVFFVALLSVDYATAFLFGGYEGVSKAYAGGMYESILFYFIFVQ